MFDRLTQWGYCDEKITMRFDSKWQLIFANIPSFAILGIILDTISETEARPVLTTTDKINRRINNAVIEERNYWRQKVNENEKKIKNLSDDLVKAQETSKKLNLEKSSYEQKAKADLDRLTKEKDNAVSDLNKTKSEFENTKKNLNTSIENLKKEIEQKKKEQETLNKKVTDTEKAKKDAEEKAKKDLDKTVKRYNSKINRLNRKITQKSAQLKAKTTQLKNLNLSFDVQSTNLYNSEAKTYNDVEILKGTIRTLQSELKALVAQAKFMDIDKMRRIKTIKNQFAIEKQNFAEQIKDIQEADVQNLLRIEKLNNLIQRLIAKNQKLEIAGKILERRLMAKIHALKKRQQQNAQQYKLLTEAYAKAESQNLVAIDHLKQELNSSVMKNSSLLKLTNHLNKVRRAEDIADSKMETNLLLKIETLKNELNIAAQKNKNLVKNIEITQKYIDNLKKAELNNSAKLQNEIQSLTTEIKTADDKYKELLQKYNNRENWAIEKLDLKGSFAISKNSAGLTGANPQAGNDDQTNVHNSAEKGYSQQGDLLGYSDPSMLNNEPLRLSGAEFMDNIECQKAVQNMENKYIRLLQNYERQEKLMMENLNKRYAHSTSERRPNIYPPAPSYYQDNNAQKGYYHGPAPHIGMPSQGEAPAFYYPPRTNFQNAGNKRQTVTNSKNEQHYYNGIAQMNKRYDNRERWKLENLAREYAPSYSSAGDGYQSKGYSPAGLPQENIGKVGYYHNANQQIGKPQGYEAPRNERSGNEYQRHGIQQLYTGQNDHRWNEEAGSIEQQGNVRGNVRETNTGQDTRYGSGYPGSSVYQRNVSGSAQQTNTGQDTGYGSGYPGNSVYQRNVSGGAQQTNTGQDTRYERGYPGNSVYKRNVSGGVQPINNFGSRQECRERLKNIEDKYNLLLCQYNSREKCMRAHFDGKYIQYRDAPYDHGIVSEYQPNDYRRAEWSKGNAAQSESPLRGDARGAHYSDRTLYPSISSNYAGNEKRDTVMPAQSHGAALNEDELVKFALDTTLKAVSKMANYDEDKILASLKLIGSEAEMPKKLSAIVDVIKDRYNPTIYQKVVNEIAKMYNR